MANTPYYTKAENDAKVNALKKSIQQGVKPYETFALLPTTGDTQTSYKITNDPTSSNNGYYHWNGTTYVKDADLADGVIESGNVDPVSGGKVYDFTLNKVVKYAPTLALLPSGVNYDAGNIAIVYDDPTNVYNGIYKKVGGKGLGGWDFTAFHNYEPDLIVLQGETVADIQSNINFDAGTFAFVTGETDPSKNGIYKKISGKGMGGWELTKFKGDVFIKETAPLNISVGDGLQDVNVTIAGSGLGNTTFGIGETGKRIQDGWANTLFGYSVGNNLTNKDVLNTWSGSLGNAGNAFFGYNIASAANGALDNTVMGTNAGQDMTTAMDTCLFGIWAGKKILAGSENVGVGHYAIGLIEGVGSAVNIDEITTDIANPLYCWGHRITAIGNLSATHDVGGNPLTQSKKSVFVGSHTRGTNFAHNENVFGYFAIGRGTDTLVLGNSEVKETSFHGILRNWTDRNFADLPTPTRDLLGSRSFILDANTRTFDSVVSGGGTNQMPVWCDGSSWRIG